MAIDNSAWSSPEADLSPQDFCDVCLVNMNDGPRADWVKAKCKLPIKKTPGSSPNANALRNAASRIFQMKGVPPDEKKKAAKKMVSMMKEADMEPGDNLMSMAGMMR